MNLKKTALLLLGALPILTIQTTPAIAQQKSVTTNESFAITIVSEATSARFDKYATKFEEPQCQPWPECM